MAMTYAYNYAVIDPNTNMCIGIQSTSDPSTGELDNMVEIAVYSDEYVFKYYIDGVWYEDAAGTIVWPEPTE